MFSDSSDIWPDSNHPYIEDMGTIDSVKFTDNEHDADNKGRLSQ